jgi:hypothetical protein
MFFVCGLVMGYERAISECWPYILLSETTAAEYMWLPLANVIVSDLPSHIRTQDIIIRLDPFKFAVIQSLLLTVKSSLVWERPRVRTKRHRP